MSTNFKSGLRVYGAPLLPGYLGNIVVGSVFFVDSTSANKSDSPSHGKIKEKPFATIDYAIGQCTANAGDVILVMPSHAETVSAAAGIDADVAGISIIGLGNGDKRPTITFATAAGADIDIDADNILVANMRFLCNIASQTAMFDVNSKAFTLLGNYLAEGTATGLTFVNVTGGAANACDRAKILHNEFYAPTAGNMDRAIELGEVADFVEIAHNRIIGDFDDAGIHNPTGKVLTHLDIHYNTVHNLLTGQHAIELVSACTGNCSDNRLYSDAYATTLDPGSLKCSGNIAVTAIDAGGVPIPALSDVTDNYIGTDDADNAAATTNVAANEDGSLLERLEQIQEAVNIGTGASLAANKSLVDAIGSTGSVLSYGSGSALGAIGTTFWVKKTLTSSAILQAGVDVTGVSSGGDLFVEDVNVLADATGLAAGTNFTLETNNVKGSAVFFSTAVSGLGANTQIDLDSASVISKTTVVESTKKIVAKMSVADGTGTGTVDIYIKFRRQSAGATIAAA